MSAREDDVERRFDALVDRYRDACLWFLRADFYPRNRERRLRVLDYIERHGDRAAYLEAARAREWLSRSSNEKSAAS